MNENQRELWLKILLEVYEQDGSMSAAIQYANDAIRSLLQIESELDAQTKPAS